MVPTGAVVATDLGSAHADYDNGAVLRSTPRSRRCDKSANDRVDARCRRRVTNCSHLLRATFIEANF